MKQNIYLILVLLIAVLILELQLASKYVLRADNIVMVLKLSGTLWCRKAERKNQKLQQDARCSLPQNIVILRMECAALVQMHFLRLQYARHQNNIHLNSVLHRMYSCSFSDRCPLSLMPYYSTAWGSSVFMFKRDFPSSFGEVLLTLHKLCDIRWWETAIKKMLHMFRMCMPACEDGGLLKLILWGVWHSVPSLGFHLSHTLTPRSVLEKARQWETIIKPSWEGWYSTVSVGGWVGVCLTLLLLSEMQYPVRAMSRWLC